MVLEFEQANECKTFATDQLTIRTADGEEFVIEEYRGGLDIRSMKGSFIVARYRASNQAVLSSEE